MNAKTARNFRGKSFNLLGYMTRKEFRQGFEDQRAGLGYRDSYETMLARQLTYERGRQFAASSPEIPSVRDGRGVSRPALAACAAEIRCGGILR